MPWCRICDEYMYASGPHKCPPEWEIIPEDECGLWTKSRPPEWSLGYGADEEHAVERWAEYRDRNGDYTILSGHEAVVYVRRPADEDLVGPAPAQRWVVSGESVPHYSADRAKI